MASAQLGAASDVAGWTAGKTPPPPPRRLPRPTWSSRSRLPGKGGSNDGHRFPPPPTGGASTHSAATTLTTSPPQMSRTRPLPPRPHASNVPLRGRRPPARSTSGTGEKTPRRCGSRRTSAPRLPQPPRSASHPPLPRPRSLPHAHSSAPWVAARMSTRATRARRSTQVAAARVRPASHPGTPFATTQWLPFFAGSSPFHPRNAAPRLRYRRGTTSSLWR